MVHVDYPFVITLIFLHLSCPRLRKHEVASTLSIKRRMKTYYKHHVTEEGKGTNLEIYVGMQIQNTTEFSVFQYYSPFSSTMFNDTSFQCHLLFTFTLLLRSTHLKENGEKIAKLPNLLNWKNQRTEISSIVLSEN